MERINWPKLAVPLVILAVIFPFLDGNSYHLHVATYIFIYIALSMGLNLLTGLAGLVDLGYIAFFAVGAYGYALIGKATGLPLLAQLPIIAGIAVCFGMVLGLPTLRVRGDYLAIVTLGFGELVRLVAINWQSLTNGPQGIRDIARPWVGIHLTTPTELYLFGLLLACIIVWVCHRIATSGIGWGWCAIRTDEDLARSLGQNVVWLKLTAFCLGATVAGVCGAFFASMQSFVSPESFVFFESVMVLSMVILGGGIGGNLAGVMAGAFVLTLLPELFRGLEDLRFPAYGIVMAVMVMARERGLVAQNWLRYATPKRPAPEKDRDGKDSAVAKSSQFGLKVESLEVDFGGLRALNGFSFTFNPGHTYGILGQNGAGKTTLINALSNVIKPTSGVIGICGKDGGPADAGVEGHRHQAVSRTFQSVKLVPDLDAFQNVLMACFPMGWRAIPGELLRALSPAGRRRDLAEKAGRAAEALYKVGFREELFGVHVSELPFGERRKVELARALVRDPSVLLLDEPLSGLASAERDELSALLHRLARSRGQVVILVEHQFKYMEGLCDTVLYMESGAIAPDEDGVPITGDYAKVVSNPHVRKAYFGTGLSAGEGDQRPASEKPILEIKNLDAAYPSRGQVLYDIDLAVPAGSITLVTGLNGAGKTTLLKSLLGIGEVKIRGGEVVYKGADLKRVGPHLRAGAGLIYVPQEKRVFGSLSVREHLMLAKSGPGSDARVVNEEDLLDRFPVLRTKWNSPARELSGGQQQMLAMIVALIRVAHSADKGSVLLLLDEPTMGLQPSLTEQTLELLRTVHERAGVTILMTEQRPEAEKIATRTFNLEAGRLYR
jgi:ABC-type branched-subunit amino acid transport system ATPase component/ABC-type branched-subunit amino acid transport system permease subunit